MIITNLEMKQINSSMLLSIFYLYNFLHSQHFNKIIISVTLDVMARVDLDNIKGW
jgi:hypothetical protein